MYNFAKRFKKTLFTMALLAAALMLVPLTGQAAASTYKQYSFVHKGSASELYTKNYSVYQIAGGFKLVRKGKTVKTVKGSLENILYSNKDFYYSTYTGTNGSYKCTVYRMTASGKSTRIVTLGCKGLFHLDTVYKNKVYGHYSQTKLPGMKTTNYVYCINVKKRKATKLCSFSGELGFTRGEDESPVVTAGKLLFTADGKAVMINLSTGKKEVVSTNVKFTRGDVDTSAWKDAKTTYIEQEDAIKKYNKKTNKFEADDSLEKYASNYSVIYADENAVLYTAQNSRDYCAYYYLYMRKAGKKTRLGKDAFTGGVNGIRYIDGPVVKGKNLYLIVSKNNKCEIWKASVKTGKAKKVKTSDQDLRFRSDNKKIGYSINDSNYTIKYICTLK